MNYKMNLGKWEFIFPVPCSVVDNYINKADLTQIKAILWVLKNKEVDPAKAAKDLAVSESDFSAALKFWEETGLFSSESSGRVAKQSCRCEALGIKKVPAIKYRKPSRSEIAARVKQSAKISHMMSEAEGILGRLITSTDQAVLIMLHDGEGLPVDVILMLLQYAVSVGKTSTKFIESMGLNWSVSGVDTLEKAEKKISTLSRNSFLWKRFESLIGIEYRKPTPSEEEIVLRWYDEWNLGDELVKYAYDKCVDKTGKYSIKYMDGILKKWHAKGIFTLQQAREDSVFYKRQKLGRHSGSFSAEDLKYNIFGDE